MSKAYQTREHVLRAGLSLIRAKGVGAVSMADVAVASGVTRQTVYFYFKNRATLLAEIVRYHDVSHGKAIFAATTMASGREGLEAFIRAWFAYLPEIFSVARELEALAASDSEVRRSWLSRQDALKAMARTIMEKLDRQEALQDGWNVEEAAEWLCAQLFPSQWQGLVIDRKWHVGRYVDVVVGNVDVVLCAGRARKGSRVKS